MTMQTLHLRRFAMRVVPALLCLCTGLFVTQLAQADTPGLTPTACITNVRTVLVNGYSHVHIEAHLGYINDSAVKIDVPIGPDNFFSPGDNDRGQPTEFLPGSHDNVFTTDIDTTVWSSITWVLNGINLQIMNDPALYCAPTVDSLSPANGLRGQVVTLTIAGSNLNSDVSVDLIQHDVTIPASAVDGDYAAITASVTIPNDAPKGFYDLRVSRPGQDPFVLPDAFEVFDSASAVKTLLRLSPGVLLAGTAGAGIFKSADGGTTWTHSNAGLTDLNVTALAAAIDGSAVYAGTLTGGVFKSTDGGATWAPAGAGLDPHIHSLLANPANPLALFAGTDKGVYKTIDGGQSWQPMTDGLP